MDFIALETTDQLKEIKNSGEFNVIFKHNVTCPISKGVKQDLEFDEDSLPANTPVYILDLLNHRELSDAIATDFNVEHESPQALVIKNGKCVYNCSLYKITAEGMAKAMNRLP